MKKRSIVSLILSLAFLIMLLPQKSEARTVWADGRNIVRSTEIADLFYEGDMVLYPDYRMSNGRYAYEGWIKYKSMADGREAIKYTTSYAGGYVQAILQFRDSICWDCPKTVFTFDYNTRDYPTSSPYGVNSESELIHINNINNAIYLDPDVKVEVNEQGHFRGSILLEK